jgi:hypothetical protein
MTVGIEISRNPDDYENYYDEFDPKNEAIAEGLTRQLRPEYWLHPHAKTCDVIISVQVVGTVDGQEGWFLEIDGYSAEMDEKTVKWWRWKRSETQE